VSVDVSVVVPTHNGATRLPTTFAHIAAQHPPSDLTWEVVLVDNGSTDGTAEAAMTAWPVDAPVPLRVVREPRLGLSYAHLRGFAEARGQIVTWVEDDNWISPDWLQQVRTIMLEHPEVGACGGFNEPVCEVDPPAWFDAFHFSYATGSQGAAPGDPSGGDVTDTRGHLWGAGLTVRKEAWDHLVGNGFRPLLVDRQGSANFNSGGDSEICFALRLAGWRLWFEPRLRLRHFLLEHRLEWGYLRRLNRGVGASTVGFDPYYRAFEGASLDARGRLWPREARRVAADLSKQARKVWASWRRPCEGDGEVLDLEWKRGRLAELLRRRDDYDRSLREIERAPWRRPPVARGALPR
jgi:glycosyltransferase involved in cell wall biosynthesis